MRLAGRFSRRLRAFAKSRAIPVLYCAPGERKHEIAERQLTATNITSGVFLILVAKAPAPLWKVIPRGNSFYLERRNPYVNHYSFHIVDPDRGHLSIKLCGYPPFPAQIMLNGHEWGAIEARRRGVQFQTQTNCFTIVSPARDLSQVADTLLGEPTMKLDKVETILGSKRQRKCRPRKDEKLREVVVGG